mgnify:CR=1 FL=1
MKIIFLDYDGVVNNLVFHTIDGEPDFYDNRTEGKPKQVNDFQAVAWLNKICREFNCEIVVTSTWRSSDKYKEYLYNAGFKGRIIDRTPLLHTKRGLEIQEWLNNNKEKTIEDFIILDDDADMVHLKSHLIQTNTFRGLGFAEYEQIKERWKSE